MVSDINLNTTKQIKGLAIILVIFSHFIQIEFLNFGHFSYAFLSAGAWGVSLFLLISGYGLTKSYEKNGLNSFFTKKYIKILIPYIIIQLTFIIIDYFILNKTYSWHIIVLSLLGLNLDIYNGLDPSMWYIPCILFWYVVFYIVFRLKISNLLKIFTLFCISCIVFLLSIQLKGQFFNLLGLYSFIFPIGVFLAIIKFKIKLKTVFSLFVVLTILFLFSWVRNPNNYNILQHMFSIISFSSAVFLGAYILQHFKFQFKILNYIGNISYELYLIEWIFLDKYNVLVVFENKYFSTALYFFIIILLANILLKLNNVIKNKFRDNCIISIIK